MVKFHTLQRSWKRTLRQLPHYEQLVEVREDRKTFHYMWKFGFCVAWSCMDGRYFTWHLYCDWVAVVEHYDYLAYAFRNTGYCPRPVMVRRHGRRISAAGVCGLQKELNGE
jgi:hypothetical protein